MNAIRYATVSALFLLAASPLLPGTANAGDVYQCVGGTSTIYQDQPCPDRPDQRPRLRVAASDTATSASTSITNPATPPAADANLRRGVDVYNGLKLAEQDRTQIEKARQAEVQAAQERYKDNKKAADAEVSAIAERWSAQMKEVQQRQDNFAAQAHEVCPNSVEIGRDGKCH